MEIYKIQLHNKFAAHAIGVFFWIAVFFLRTTGIFNYNLLLYSYTPWYSISDMDGLGHMVKPVMWFNFYWLLFGGTQVNPLYLKKLKLTYGAHELSFIINGKPVRAAIDPYNKLIDRMPNDNFKGSVNCFDGFKKLARFGLPLVCRNA